MNFIAWTAIWTDDNKYAHKYLQSFLPLATMIKIFNRDYIGHC